ncbi:MAG: hypothetical protein AAGJ35_16015, partial [Myxococcota bacterium]
LPKTAANAIGIDPVTNAIGTSITPNHKEKENNMSTKLSFPDQKDLQERLSSQRPKLLEIPDEKVRTPRVSPERAMELSQMVLTAWVPFKTVLSKIFSPKRIEELERAVHMLPTTLFVFLAATLEASTSWSEKEKQRFRALAKKVQRDDLLYMNFCRTVFVSNVEMEKKLDQIQAGRGHQDSAEDVIELTHIIRSSPEVTLPNMFFSEQDVRQSQEDAIQFMWMLKGRQEGKAPKASPPDIWHRAYTQWAETYEQIAFTGQYLCALERKDAKDFPRIHTPPKKSSQTNSTSSSQEA